MNDIIFVVYLFIVLALFLLGAVFFTMVYPGNWHSLE